MNFFIIKCSTHSKDLNDYKFVEFVEFGQVDQRLLFVNNYYYLIINFYAKAYCMCGSVEIYENYFEMKKRNK